MPELLASILDQVRLTTLLDIGLTAVLIYWLFSLIRGTRAVRLVIGVSVLFVVYFAAQAFTLRLLTQILQAGAVVGFVALVVIFQPELRRALERIGRVGSFAWLFPAENREADRVAAQVARAAALLSGDGHGALIVLERDTGLEEIAETGVMIHGDLSVDLLRTIFTPRAALHDGAVIVRGPTILAAGALLPLAETTVHSERLGTRHRAALGITEQTDAVVVVVSEENGQVSLVERARIVRNLSELQLARSLRALLHSQAEQGRFRLRSAAEPTRPGPAIRGLGGLVGRPASTSGARDDDGPGVDESQARADAPAAAEARARDDAPAAAEPAGTSASPR
ncbi:MAG TPA: diadenylate cyclase CdaA [Candidatus Sulfomarinibacteraceae bacterium]|nr:diadenylate cyclase CdaA [Candidatus Sulfomarinibacteraceae bacterium]